MWAGIRVQRSRLAGVEREREFAEQRLKWPASGKMNVDRARGLRAFCFSIECSKLTRMFRYLSSVCSIDWSHVGRILSASIPLLIAGIATFIAWEQFVINRRQYRLALFEKRMAVFNSTMNMIASVVQSANPQLADCMKFIRDTRDHELLFGPEVGTFIIEVYNKAIKLRTQNAVGADTAAQQTETLNWFIAQMSDARKVFLKYLDFRKP